MYVDGFQALHEPGTALFGDIGEVQRVVVGADLGGTRLFGEAQTGLIFEAGLADQRVSSLNDDSPNDTNFATRRSLDGGVTGEDSRTLRYPGSRRLGASVTDSVIVQDRSSDRVIVVMDQFPGGYRQADAEVGTGDDNQGRMVPHRGKAPVSVWSPTDCPHAGRRRR